MGKANPPAIGTKFKWLEVIEHLGTGKYGSIVLCRCKCGKTCKVWAMNLKCGDTKSCSCLKNKHGDTKDGERSKEYWAWTDIKRKCYNKKYKSYPQYGARGVKACPRWLESYANFLADMGRAPGPEYSIDRKDNDGDYEPGNCRWATAEVQANNRRDNRKITHNGVTMNLVEWARTIGVSGEVLSSRLKEHSMAAALSGDIGWAKRITLNGETKTIAEWAKAAGMTYIGLYHRLRRYPPEVALTRK